VILLVGACSGKGAAIVDHRCVKTNDHAVAAGHSVDPARWQEAFEGLMDRISGRFARIEPRRHVRQLALGLLSDLPRKNCWTIAEWAGEATPDGMQHLLGRAKWDADQVRDDVREYVVEHLRDDQAVLVVDETGDVKKGTRTVGVQRQYTGTAGRIENSQVAVYLVYAGRRGHAAVDRELYVPRSWQAKELLRDLLGLAVSRTHLTPDRSAISAARHRFLSHVADHAHLPELVTLAETVEQWWDGIETYLATGITNAASEGNNRLIKLEARNAFGFRNRENQRLRSRCATTRRSRREAHPH
jgi:DDE superfamily endonuclease